ncbi:MAG TPA: transposase [Actinomycetes bacterium]|nr:transposase [Actinomycetes bacterium]
MAADQKGAGAESAWLVFFDESAVSLIPPVRRTWSPRGRTPILRHRFGWKKASMAAALGYRPDGSAARLCFHLQQPSYTTDRLIEVLEQLAGFYAGHKVVLLWDGLSAHWSTKMRAWLDSQRDWLTAQRLPAYAPELNPVEYLWANLRTSSWPTCHRPRWPRSPRPPNKASNGSASTRTWWSGSWPTLACPSTHEPSTQPTKLNNGSWVLG